MRQACSPRAEEPGPSQPRLDSKRVASGGDAWAPHLVCVQGPKQRSPLGDLRTCWDPVSLGFQSWKDLRNHPVQSLHVSDAACETLIWGRAAGQGTARAHAHG